MSNRSRLKLFTVTTAVLVVGMVATCIVIGKAQERKEFLGKVNKAGYRCRFTLSPNWQQDKTNDVPPDMEYEAFSLSPSPMRDWIDKHILRRTAVQLPPINLTGGDMTRLGAAYRLVDGYPEPGPQTRIRIIRHRHQRIDGSPATVLSWERVSGNGVRRGTILLVSTRDQTSFYEVSGWTGTQSTDRFDQIDREIQAIVASFHVEKVAVPASSSP